METTMSSPVATEKKSPFEMLTIANEWCQSVYTPDGKVVKILVEVEAGKWARARARVTSDSGSVRVYTAYFEQK